MSAKIDVIRERDGSYLVASGGRFIEQGLTLAQVTFQFGLTPAQEDSLVALGRVSLERQDDLPLTGGTKR
ncbi:hypothetical protein [Methylobacter sp.]|uniref:hypothetical protein n=1 Tax=Methylobacter sp. TaxID=2051955 RepID=UPI00121A9676|nr:hypothetical protein [Methylobacter sp.]TAK59551.1 MAG: hypothetical protein EPO18_20530 [Methylobacter sp.]